MKILSVIFVLAMVMDDSEGSNRRWSKINGQRLEQLDVSQTGEVVWGVSRSSNVYLRLGSKWQRIQNRISMKHVSVGGAGVWGVSENNRVYYRTGVSAIKLKGKGWRKVPGLFKQVDSGPPGIVYAVNAYNRTRCRDGITTDKPRGRRWRIVPGKRLKYISCGGLGCWGVSPLGTVWFREGVNSTNCIGTKYVRVPGKWIEKIEVTGDGKAYTINKAGTVRVRVGVTPNRPRGSHWKVIKSSKFKPILKHVSASESAIWAIGRWNNVYHFTGLDFPEERYAILLTYDFPKGGIGQISVRNPVDGVTYSLSNASDIVEIDSHSGHLSLLVNADEQHLNKVNNSRFDVTAQLGKRKRNVEVIIYVLPLNHGDPLALPAMAAVRGSSLRSQTIVLSYGPAAEITSELLDRSLKQLPGSDPAVDISEAETRLERAIDLVKLTIIHAFEREYGQGAVLAFYHNEQLFSRATMTLLVRESDCHEIEEHIECPESAKYRRSDGRCTNTKYPLAGAAGEPYIRLSPAKYFDPDGLNDPIGFPNQPDAPQVPSPFKISKEIFNTHEVAAAQDLTSAVMQMGQFLDHDLDLAAGGEGSTACSEIRCDGSPDDFIPPCYPILPLENNEPPCVRFVRSSAVCTRDGFPAEREQLNVITGAIDGNNVYGSSENDTRSLRDLTNDRGLLRVSISNGLELLPEENGTPLAPCISGCFQAGDARANEQQGLTSFHTLFLREHNRIARQLKILNSHWDGETIFQETRKIVVAIMQKIVYDDYLPIILGPNALLPYTQYNENVEPSISNAFAAAAYRFGHSTIRSTFDLLDENFDPVAPAVQLRSMFFDNTITKTRGIEPMLLGLIGNVSEKVDTILTAEITEHLFERPDSHGENLAALNIQRSRDHGLPGYNIYRQLAGLSDAQTFDDTSNEIQNANSRDILKRLYNDDPNLVELWVAGLAEVPHPGATVGPTLRYVIAEQFTRSRDGDRFFYENPGVFTEKQLQEIKNTSLSRLYCNNVHGIVSIQRNAFRSAIGEVRPSCGQIPKISLCQWKECNNGVPELDSGIPNTCRCR